jgi:hypothetical protein
MPVRVLAADTTRFAHASAGVGGTAASVQEHQLIFCLIHATSYSFYSSVTIHCTGERRKTWLKTIPPPNGLRNPYKNLKYEIKPRNLNKIVRSWIRLQCQLMKKIHKEYRTGRSYLYNPALRVYLKCVKSAMLNATSVWCIIIMPLYFPFLENYNRHFCRNTFCSNVKIVRNTLVYIPSYNCCIVKIQYLYSPGRSILLLYTPIIRTAAHFSNCR